MFCAHVLCLNEKITKTLVDSQVRKHFHVKAAKRILVLRFEVFSLVVVNRGSTVVKVLCYKSEGRWFDSRWCQWNFSLT